MSRLELQCPYCGNVSNAQTAADGTDAHPEPGNLMICCECGSMNILNEDGLSTHIMTDEEKLNPDFQADRPHVEAYCTAVRAEYDKKK